MRNYHKVITILTVSALFFSARAMAGEEYPRDVVAFVHDAEICQYVSGEWDSTLPDDRKKELTRESDRYCKRINERQKHLDVKYAGKRKITSRINSYDFGN